MINNLTPIDMKHFKFLFALVIAWMAATVCVLADEVTFNYTHQGVTLPYLVLSETDKTCGVISQRDHDLLFETMKATSIVIPETVTYNGNTYTSGLKLNSGGTVKFTTTETMNMAGASRTEQDSFSNSWQHAEKTSGLTCRSS